jgi:hypothetical protein
MAEKTQPIYDEMLRQKDLLTRVLAAVKQQAASQATQLAAQRDKIAALEGRVAEMQKTVDALSDVAADLEKLKDIQELMVSNTSAIEGLLNEFGAQPNS